VVPLADRAIGNLQQWLIGTHHGVSPNQLQVYLDATIGAANLWPRSRLSSASEQHTSPHPTLTSELPRICGLTYPRPAPRYG
jgi:hypothetical protein